MFNRLAHLTQRILAIVLIAAFIIGSAKPLGVQALQSADEQPVQGASSPTLRTQAEILADAPSTLEISAAGFQPELLQVSVGQAVTFKNSDTVTRRLRLVFQPSSITQRIFLPLALKNGTNLTSTPSSTAESTTAASPQAPTLDEEIITLTAGSTAQRTYPQPGNVQVSDADQPAISAEILITPLPLDQQGWVIGQVLNWKDKTPLVGVQVSAINTTFKTSTDSAGKYRLALPPGNYTLVMFGSGFTFANRAVTVQTFSELLVDTVELVPLDQKVTSITAAGGSAANTTGTTNVQFAAGAVDSTKAVRLTELRVDPLSGNTGDTSALPGPFSDGSVPLGFVMFDPDGTKFSAPAVWTIEYNGDLEVGTAVPCYYWLEANAKWSNPVSGMVVDLGNNKKGLRATLPHFSSYGFALPPPPDPDPRPPTPPPPGTPQDNPNSPCQGAAIGSLVNTVTGELCQTVGTVDLPSAGGLPSQVTAKYFSLNMSSNYHISADLKVGPNSWQPYTEWMFEIAGNLFYERYSKKVDVNWDGRDANGRLLPPGVYEGKLTAVYSFPMPCPRGVCLPLVFRYEIPWPVTISRPDLSPFGLGWFSPYDTLLVDSGTYAALLLGDGRTLAFKKTDTSYEPPRGDFSTLVHNPDGTWTRSLRDGSNMTFNADGRLTQIADRYGNFQILLYESNGKTLSAGQWGLTTRLRRVTDTSGNTFDFAYDSGGWLSSITDNVGRVYGLEHDAQGRLTTFTNPLSQSQAFAYDSRGLMTSHTDARGATTSYIMDNLGRLVSRTWPTGSTLQMTYSPTRTVMTDDRGSILTTNLGSNWDPLSVDNGIYTTYTSFNANGLPVMGNQPPQSASFDANGNLTGLYQGIQVSQENNGPFNQVSRQQTTTGADNQLSYDAAGNLVSFTDILGQVYAATYTAQGQLASITDPLGNSIALQYNAQGLVTQLTDGLNHTYQMSYDSAGRLTSATDPLNHTSNLQWNALNRLTSFVDALSGHTTYQYDANGNLTGVSDPGGRTFSFTYDSLNRLTRGTSPGGVQEDYRYDAVGNLVGLTDARGQVINWTYDAANRATQKQVVGGPTVNYTYDNLDQLTSVSDGALAMSFSYLPDIQGYPSSLQQLSSSMPISATLSYDYSGMQANGEPSALTQVSQSDTLPPEQRPLQVEPAMPSDPLALYEAPVAMPVELSDPVPYYEERVDGDGTQAPSTNVGGVINTNTTWTLAGSPYIATSSVTVAAGFTLTIQPGVQVQFNQSYGLTINGTLLAVGTAAQPISFTGTTAQRGWWSGIQFEGATLTPLTGSTLSYVTVSDGGYYSSRPANLYLYQARVTLSNATIQNSYYNGIYGTAGGLADISNTTLTGNGIGYSGITYAIWLTDGSVNPTLGSLTVQGNARDAIAFGPGSLTTRTWKSLGVPYVFTGHQTVPTGATLTVEPGVEAQFNQSYGLTINGTLMAVGTAAQPISFTGTTAQRGWWSGIQFEGTTLTPLTGSTLSYVTVSDGGYYSSRPGNLYLYQAQVTLSNANIQNSFYNGIYGSSGGLADISNTTLTGNGIGYSGETYPIWFSDGSVNPNLDSLTIQGNARDAIAFGPGILTTRTWKSLGVPYVFTGSQTVPSGATLTVEEGVEVMFKQSNAFTINGRLMAVGTAAQPISFTGTTAQRGWWSGIEFAGTIPTPLTGSTLSYVTVSDGGYYSSRPANIYLYQAHVILSNAAIQNSFYNGIYGSSGGLADISNTTLTGNGLGYSGQTYPIWFSDGSVNPDLNSLTIQGNARDAIAFGPATLTTRTWKSLGVPYVFTGHQTVSTGATLTVEPGVEAQFNQSYGLTINGTLMANGSPIKPILFTGTTAQRGWWSGVDIEGNGMDAINTGSQLSYVTIAFGGYYSSRPANLVLKYASVSIEHSHFWSSAYNGIYAYVTPNVVIHSSTFQSNTNYGLLNASPLNQYLIDAAYNYWGSTLGPNETNTNPASPGQKITNGIVYAPWSAANLLPGHGRISGLHLSSNANQPQAMAYSYDATGQVVQIRSAGYTTYTHAYTYDTSSRVTGRLAVSGAPLSESFSYDAADQVTSIGINGPAGSLLTLNYSYDAAGNITGLTSSRDGLQSYTYDALNRLTSVNSPGFSATYAYDPSGNRTQAGNVTYTYDTGGRLVSASDGTSYTYDAAGNLLSRTKGGQTTSFTWDEQGRLTRISYPGGTSSEYQYDEFGRRIHKHLPDGTDIYYIYAGLMLLQELDGAGTVLASYTYDGLDRPVSMWRDGKTYYYLRDHLGSVLGLVDESGALAATYRYDPWGNLISSSGSLDNPLRFAAREYDGESGLYFVRARYYDPQAGRFISRDPLGIGGGLNLYAYAGNNPLIHRDTSGQFFWLALIAVAVGIAVVAIAVSPAVVTLDARTRAINNQNFSDDMNTENLQKANRVTELGCQAAEQGLSIASDSGQAPGPGGPLPGLVTRAIDTVRGWFK